MNFSFTTKHFDYSEADDFNSLRMYRLLDLNLKRKLVDQPDYQEKQAAAVRAFVCSF